jgi:hypothetical protein
MPDPRSPIPARPYTAAQAASLLGICPDTFYRDYARLVADDGMPPRLRSHGRYAFHRGAFDAWLARTSRYRTLRDAACANDDATALQPCSDAWRDALAREYGAGR